MNRLGLIHPSTLGGRHMTETRTLYEAFTDYSAANYDAYFTSRLRSTGALIGPFGLLLHSPPVGRSFLDLAASLRNLPALKPKVREIAIVTVAVHEQASYELYAHSRIAFANGVTPAELNAVAGGRRPSTFDDEETAAYNVARELCIRPGPLAQPTWNTAVNLLGRDGALTLIHVVAYHRYVATLIRGFDAQVPAEIDRVENQ